MTIRITPPRENIIRAAFGNAALQYLTPDIEAEIGRRMEQCVPDELRPQIISTGLGPTRLTEVDSEVLSVMPCAASSVRILVDRPSSSIHYSLQKLKNAGIIKRTGSPMKGEYTLTGVDPDEAVKTLRSRYSTVEERRQDVVSLRNTGHSMPEIAKKLRISTATVYRDLKERGRK